MDALDSFEDLSEMGHHLADLPVAPRYGKTILYGVVLKCLDPVLTITSTMAYKDPCEFCLPRSLGEVTIQAVVVRQPRAFIQTTHYCDSTCSSLLMN